MGHFPKWHALKAVLGKSEASAADRMVLTALIMHSNNEGECFPSIDLLAEETGMSSRSVMRSLASLEKGIRGLPIIIERGWRKGKWRNHSRHYVLQLGGKVMAEVRKQSASDEAFHYEELERSTVTERDRQSPSVATDAVDGEEKSRKPSETLTKSKTRKKVTHSHLLGPNLLKRKCQPVTQEGDTQSPPESDTQSPEDYKEDYTEVSDDLSVMALRSITSPEKPQTASRAAGGSEPHEPELDQDTTGPLTSNESDDWDESTEYAGPRQLRLDGSVEPTCKQVQAALCDRVWSRYMEHWHKHVGRGQVPKRTKDRRRKIVRRIHEFGVDKVLLAVDTLFNPDSFWGANGHHGIQYVIRSADQCEKVLTRAAELADPSLAPKRRSVVPVGSTNGSVRSMSGDNAPIQLPPEGHKGYRARITYTPEGAFDREGNRLDDAEAHSEASLQYREMLRRKQAERRARTESPDGNGMQAAAEA